MRYNRIKSAVSGPARCVRCKNRRMKILAQAAMMLTERYSQWYLLSVNYAVENA